MVGKWNASACIGGLRKKRESKGGVDISLLLKVVEELIYTFILPGVSLDLRRYEIFPIPGCVGIGWAWRFGLGLQVRGSCSRECCQELDEPPPRDVEIHDLVLI